MVIDIGGIKNEIYTSISKGYNWLFNQAIHSGHWQEVRSTALVGLCLELREPINSPWLIRIKEWLLDQQKPIGIEMASWAEELWDSSMALISLKHIGLSENDPQYKQTITWMKNLYNKNNRHNWHDEPWETSWSLLAILETKSTPEISKIANGAIKWLLGLQDANGKIVSPHYTAYFILAGYKLMNYDLVLSIEEKNIMSFAIKKAKEYLINIISEDILWTGESWSNGQILWALSYSKNIPYTNMVFLQQVVNWFVIHQNKEKGNWDDVEDTASAILGLYHFLKQIEETKVGFEEHDLRKKLNEYLKTPTLCLKRKLIQVHDDGYTSINLGPKVKRVMVILFILASGLSVVIALWDYIKRLFGL